MFYVKKPLALLLVGILVLSFFPLAVGAVGSDGGRLAGEDRVATAIAVANTGWSSPETVIIACADQENLIDSLACSPLAGQENAPILLTTKSNLDPRVKSLLQSWKPGKVYVVGAIQDNVRNEIAAVVSPATVTTLRGANRWDTARQINAQLRDVNGTFVIGANALPDALSVASYASAKRWQIVLADNSRNVPSGQSTRGEVILIGGPTLVNDISGATRIYGSDRFQTNQAFLSNYASSFDYGYVYVASGLDQHLVNALVIAPRAAQTNSFVALGDGSRVAATDLLQNNMNSSSYVVAVGGTAALPETVKQSVLGNSSANSGSLTITSQPQNTSANSGQTASFGVTVSGGSSPYYYQWEYNTSTSSSGWTKITGATNRTYSVTANSTTQERYYRCVVSDSASRSITSSYARLTLSGSLRFTSQPSNQYVDSGDTARFSVDVAGGTSPYKYQWQENDRSSNSSSSYWENIGSETSRSYSLTARSRYDGYYYRCVVTDNSGTTIRSNAALLSLDGSSSSGGSSSGSLYFSEEPKDQYADVGDTVEFTVRAAGGRTPYSYQWQRSSSGSSWSNISGETERTYSFKVTQSIANTYDGYYYRCRVKDNNNYTEYSQTARFFVPLTISSQPSSPTQTLAPGTAFSLSITVSNGRSPYWFTWESSNSQSSGFTVEKETKSTSSQIDTCTFKAPSDYGVTKYYRCVVYDNSNKYVTSRVVSVTTTPAPATTVVYLANIPEITPPVAGAAPVTKNITTDQYTGTIRWSPEHNPYKPDEVYTATITLTAKDGYTLTGVSANFFKVSGASTTNSADSGVVTAVFPATAKTIDNKTIPFPAPAAGELPVTDIATAEYTGTVSWSPSDSTFQPDKVYTATITLTAKTEYTLIGVTENYFEVSGASTTTNNANNGVVKAVFPATAKTITNKTIQLPAPATGSQPVLSITETDHYTGTVSWYPNDDQFKPDTVYTATITLTVKEKYTFVGVTENFFIVANTPKTTNSANSGIVTVEFPKTGSN